MNKPIHKGYARVPMVMQMEALECGAASLDMILAYYNKWIALETVRSDCGVSRDGSNAKNVLKAARSYGLQADGYRMEPDELREDGDFPCIIHWNFNHFVVLCGFKGKKAVINDPARGTVLVSEEEFDRSFTGICLCFEPGEDFTPSGKPQNMLSFAAERMKGAWGAVAFIALTTLILTAVNLIRPAFSRIFLDRLLTGRSPEWITPFLLALGALAMIQIVVSSLQAICSMRIQGKLGVTGSASFLWKIMQLPMDFFSQRMAADLQNRQDENATIAADLVKTFAPLLLKAASMVFYLVVMLRYNPLLSLVGIGSVLINLFLSGVISKKRINITRVQMRDSGKLSSATVSGIEMIETIKASGAEAGFFEKWSGHQASVNTQMVRFAKLDAFLGSVPQMVSGVSGIVVLLLGVWFAMEGNLTAGMLMAFQGFLTSFEQPATELISAGQILQEMRTRMERVDDVIHYPVEETFRESTDTEEGEYGKLSGMIEIKNVSFGYARLEKPLIQNFSMTLKPGQRVAFVGSSGCGKSTLAKLISGLYKPWEGEILFDGKPMSQIDHAVFCGSVSVVDQEVTLFEDTIANNIKMWDESVEDFEMILAARDADIHTDILKRPGGYNYKLTEGGRDLSGGQRQRLEIARVLAQDPTIMIMDEATSALDARTEYNVVNAIKNRGITCIVIAHRLSTIRDCDEIIVLDKGQVVQRGTHEELFAQDGLYRRLVTND